jgi:hypothetical protein
MKAHLATLVSLLVMFCDGTPTCSAEQLAPVSVNRVTSVRVSGPPMRRYEPLAIGDAFGRDRIRELFAFFPELASLDSAKGIRPVAKAKMNRVVLQLLSKLNGSFDFELHVLEGGGVWTCGGKYFSMKTGWTDFLAKEFTGQEKDRGAPKILHVDKDNAASSGFSVKIASEPRPIVHRFELLSFLGNEPEDTADALLDGLKIVIVPGKPEFKPDELVYLNIAVTNTSDTTRYLGICPVASNGVHEDGPGTTEVDVGGRTVEIGGMPCYIHLRGDVSWDVRLNSNGYSDRYTSSLELEPKAKASFRVIVPARGDNKSRPTGRINVFSRFAVARKVDGPPENFNGPESSVLLVDRAKLDPAVAILKDAMTGKSVNPKVIQDALRIVADHPGAEHVELMIDVLKHPWPASKQMDWTLWYAASKYVHPEIYRAAIAATANPELDGHQVYETLLRNRVHLKRTDILKILKNLRLEDEEFTRVNDYGFYATMLLAMVAQEDDIPLLGDLCGRFIPVGISHDLCHATLPDRRLVPIREAFLRYPITSKVALRKLLRQGMKPGEYPPWAHEFSVGNVPRPLVIAAQWLAALQDTEALSMLEHYATTDLVRVSNTMRQEAPGLIAAIDGTEAIKTLRRIGADREAAQLGDPVAIDARLQWARLLHDHPIDCVGDSASIRRRIYSMMNPGKTPTLEDIGDGTAIEKQWKELRPEFVGAFIMKYGFNPDE